jgi:hypothetical protein
MGISVTSTSGTGHRSHRLGACVAATFALATLVLIGLSGHGAAQAQAQQAEEPPPFELATEGQSVDLMRVTLTFDEEVNIDVVGVVGLGDGEPLGFVSPTHPTDISNTFGAWQRSISFTVAANDNFRYLYYRIGDHIEANGLELWSDDLGPVLERLVLDQPADDPIALSIDIELLPAFDASPGPYAHTCTFTGGGRNHRTQEFVPAAVEWPESASDLSLELWYDDEPLVRDLDGAARSFTLTSDTYNRKFASSTGLALVTLVTTPDGIHRVGVKCTRPGYVGPGAAWSVGTTPSCRVDLSTGWLTAHTPSDEPLNLYRYTTRTATEPLMTVHRRRSAAPPATSRSDTVEFGSIHRFRVDDTFLNDAGRLTTNGSGQIIGMLHEGTRRPCATSYGAGVPAATAALTEALSTRTSLANARQHLAEPHQAVHLLEFLRWETSSAYPYLSLSAVDATSALLFRGPRATAGPPLVVEKVDERWVINTRSLCRRVAALLKASGSDRRPCGARGTTTDMCRAFRLTAGKCRSQVVKHHLPVLRATNGLLNSGVRDFVVDGRFPLARPDSRAMELQSIERQGRNATVTLARVDGTTVDLVARRLPEGWMFTKQSAVAAGFTFRR